MQHGDPTISPYLSVFRSVTPARQICQQCRARKVRCDGRPSTCHNCERLGFQCSLARPDELAPVPAKRPDTRPARLRGQNPCSQCRRRKVRCSNDYPECASCIKHGRSCSYLTSPVTRQWARDPGENPEQDPPTPRQQVSSPNATLTVDAPEVLGDSGLLSGLCTERTTQGDPSHRVATELILNFFQHLYPVPSYAFLHPSTTLAKHRRGTLDQSLVLAICALTSLHVALPHPLLVDRRQSAEWVSTAEETIWKCLEHPSMPRLQALLLVISYRMATGGYEKAFMLMAIAARAASAMGLNHEHTDLDPIAEETRRRSVWCFKLLDAYFSIGLTEFELCPFECLYLQPPSDEDSFSLLCPPGTEDFAIHTLAHHRELGSLNMCIRLVSIRRDIMKLTRELAVYSKPYLHLKTVTAGLEEALLQLRTEMPSKGTTSTAYLKDMIKSPWLPRHIMMITLWHGCYFDLYRIFLPGYPEAPPDVVLNSIDVEFSQTARTTCVDHALAAVGLFCDLDQACTEPRMLELATGVCVYHAIRLILFVAHPLTELHMLNSEYAISRAEQCLAAMKRFFHGLALAQPIITDMAQLIATCSSNDPTTNSLFVFHQVNQGRKSDARVLSAAQPRQRLAVHSILQEARFPVEEPL